MTVKQKTPNGRYHYTTYLNIRIKMSKHCLIENYLRPKSGYRSSGIDVHSNGGYFVSSPSVIEDDK